MKKMILSLAVTLISTSAFAQTTYQCREDGAKGLAPVVLQITATDAQLGGHGLVRDTSYIGGNGGKTYHRYSSDILDVLVPSLMARDKTNQGVIVVYTIDGDQVRLSCVK